MTEYFAVLIGQKEYPVSFDGNEAIIDGGLHVVSTTGLAIMRRRLINREEYERLLARRTIGSASPDRLVSIAAVWSAVEIADKIGAERVRDLVMMLRACRDEARRGYEAEARPHLDMLKEIRTRWRTISQPLDDAITMLRGKITTWLSAQKALLGLKEAPEHAIVLDGGLICHESPPPATALLRGARPGRAMYLVRRWAATVEDWMLACERYRGHPDLVAVLERLATTEAMASKGRKIPGFTIETREEAR